MMMNNFSLAITIFGWDPSTIMLIFVLSVIGTSIAFFIIISTTKSSIQRFREKKKYRLEAIWSVFVAGVLIWIFVTSLSWTPPTTFSEIKDSENGLQVINITAGQWFWLLQKVDADSNSSSDLTNSTTFNPPLTVKQNMPVKFVATSIDVNHGFGIFSGAQDGSPILLQMQVIPGMQNVFYYTFKESGDFHIRCLEYCGYAHPYMTSTIHVVPENDDNSDSGDIKRVSNNVMGVSSR